VGRFLEAKQIELPGSSLELVDARADAERRWVENVYPLYLHDLSEFDGGLAADVDQRLAEFFILRRASAVSTRGGDCWSGSFCEATSTKT
jgi:hypothetical protein